MTERPETIDKKKVLEMYKSGMTQKRNSYRIKRSKKYYFWYSQTVKTKW